jgi:hypothetical protein
MGCELEVVDLGSMLGTGGLVEVGCPPHRCESSVLLTKACAFAMAWSRLVRWSLMLGHRGWYCLSGTIWLIVWVTVRAVWFLWPPAVSERVDIAVGEHQSYALWEEMPGNGIREM